MANVNEIDIGVHDHLEPLSGRDPRGEHHHTETGTEHTAVEKASHDVVPQNVVATLTIQYRVLRGGASTTEGGICESTVVTLLSNT